ncbi:hypothetical protein KR067_011171, partial [Drosophila pandora]
YLYSFNSLISLAICRYEPYPQGNCGNVISGFTFITEKNGCSPYAVSACSASGNFFNSRYECESKCKEDF